MPLPGDLPLERAALVEPVAVAVHDVRRARVQPDEYVVAGGGPIGQLIALVSEHAGARVLLMELDPARRAIAEAHKPTVDEITRELPGITEIDRTGVNSGEDADFRAAIEDTGRRKIVMAGLWTEVCLAFPTLDMLAEGYEIYPVIDVVGGVSAVSHQTAIDRMLQAGAQPITSLAFGL